ncbi:17.1 kDa class II heat shock protein-like [Tripterygium wilfordii]|uniref:17.1 kDa class II heat shock protein-like n=1 Tax=Tripterygium wilfordii TaxID=458696 RepID=A0A7J7DAR7_TRIWF|nr:17.1 kDa class II heat shock protein-like [Tripterygium wilfordii]KAF5743166.1 17.1 kDa class II heat shock protein-like [Tripterygium wilfordii]
MATLDLRGMGIDQSLIDILHDIIDLSDEQDKSSHQAPSRAYVRDAKAMTATPADVIEYPNAYVYIIDMPGLKKDQIKVHMEDNMLVVSGERKREREKEKEVKEGIKYIRMERRLGKYLKKFVLPENADPEKISAVYQDGVLTATVEKKKPPEPKKPKSIEVHVA